MGGEKAFYCGGESVALGSPPHGRGKELIFLPSFFSMRITPAWAGKSTAGLACAFVTRDHPRMGGEKLGRTRLERWRLGSPPHGRGKGRCGVKGQRPFRITPAWAGKSPSDGAGECRRKDHPRMGGEKLFGTVSGESLTGSPPHGRGKGPELHEVTSEQGITPAWAGKSSEPDWR